MLRSIWTLLSLVIVGFGQPAFSPLLGILASSMGYALFWSVLINIPQAKKRFWYSTLWFGSVQAIQLSWFPSHPFGYIYALYLFLCFFIGMQFGVLGIFITPQRVKRWSQIAAITGLYTVLEWSRLFLFSGFSLNPIGLSLTGTLYGLQNASLFGVYGLTFFILFLNFIALHVFLYNRSKIGVYCLACLAPYIFGYSHIALHRPSVEKAEVLNVLLVQTAFPVEDNLEPMTFQASVKFVERKWEQILKVLQPFQDKDVDLLVLPEYVVPYGTYVAIFPYENVEKTFENMFGLQGKKALPELKEPLALEINKQWQVTNAYYAAALANLFQADLVLGLQDDQWINERDTISYSAALYFWPGGNPGFRYEKQVLLPMGEYIPFDFCKSIASRYGITGSFHPGDEAKVFPGSKVPFGLSICYEETFGNLMLESRLKGSELLINVTSDVWYPNSRLPKQHFDHARLRSVEAGIPLVRACNTGITSALNSLGEIVGSLTEEEEWVRQGLLVKVPLYHYQTLYSKLGDLFIISLSLILCLFLIKKSS